jgi:alkaline phosphatase D
MSSKGFFPRGALLVALVCISSLPASAQSPHVDFVWSGALQPTSIRIVAGLSASADSVRVALTAEETFDGAYVTAYESTREASHTASFQIEALEPDTPYRYAVEVAGALDTLKVGAFRTPPEGPFSFRLIAAGCAITGSDRPVFDVIRRQNPLFYLALGDFHYENIDSDDPEAYRQAYREVLDSPPQAALYRSTPIAYIWDDHDFGPNNSDRMAPGREAARLAYQEMIPHYPLVAGRGNVPIFQSFAMGRIRFILTDLRSSRLPGRRAFGRTPTMMGARQKDWFKQELLRAKRAGEVIVWVSSVPWIYRESESSDSWGGYHEEREEIANFIKEHAIDDIVILGGDAHMVAMDDGTNSDYATGGGAPIPVIQSAPLDQAGSSKGGPYSEGEFPGPTVFPPHPGQWTLMNVEDEGRNTVCMTWTAYRTRWDRPSSRPLVDMSRCFDVPAYEPPEVAEEGDAAQEDAAEDAAKEEPPTGEAPEVGRDPGAAGADSTRIDQQGRGQ